jgi:coenzyme F420-reducing hydrogenase beta subunit
MQTGISLAEEGIQMINITEKHKCTGCHACKNICPKQCILMESDSEGFLYPKVNLKSCVDCGLCEKVCPVLQNKSINNEPLAYACHNKDDQVRLESSSGGIFTLIAEQIINDGGVVFGVGLEKDLTAVHSYVETKEQLGKFRGSKYVQSKIGETYEKAECFLKQNRQVLFTGTPCQIAGLKAYLQRDYDNLFCIDIICHGVPSAKVWQKYVSYHENRVGAKVQSANFRHKNKGWKRFSMSLLFNNGTMHIQTLDKDLFLQAFLKDTCLRPSCHNCNFKTLHRQSDITLADFWGVQNVLPKHDDDKGTSLILVNSTQGKLMFDRIQDEISSEIVDINKAVSYNPAVNKSARQNPIREKFFDEVDVLSFDKLVNKYCSDSIAVKTKRAVKSIAYTVLEKTGLLAVVKKVLKSTE